MMSARLISVPAGGSGSPLTGRNVLQFPGRFLLENGDFSKTATATSLRKSCMGKP